MKIQKKTYHRYQGKREGDLLFLLALLVLAASGLAFLLAPYSVRKFAAFPALAGVFLALYGVSTQLSVKWGRVMRAALTVTILVGVALFTALEIVIVANSHSDLDAEPDVVVVLGAQIHEWGPSVLLADRLDTALRYLEDHPDMPVIVSGGQGPDEPATEASAMRDYLVARGLEESRVWLEEESHNTSQNLQYTRVLLSGRGLDPDETRLLVVSNGFHLARVRMLADRQGLTISTLAAPSSHAGARMQSYIREAPALIKSWLLDR